MHIDTPTDGAGHPAAFYAVACPATRLCFAFDNAGNVFSSVRPAGGKRAWRHVHLAGATTLRDISCPSRGWCAGLTKEGQLATIGNPASRNAKWTVSDLDVDGYLASLFCPTALFCIAGDTYGNVLVGEAHR
jgi:hypothetical protein